MVGFSFQTAYTAKPVEGRVGAIAYSGAPYHARAYIVELDEMIPFGVACHQGTAYNEGQLGLAAADNFIGFVFLDITMGRQFFQQYDTMAIIREGMIWVMTDAAVAVADDVTVNADTGVPSTKAKAAQVGMPADANYAAAQIGIEGGRFETAVSAAAGGLAIMSLNGILTTDTP